LYSPRLLLLLTDLLTPDRIRIPLEATTKDGLLRELVDIVAANESAEAHGDVLRAVQEREAVLSTGIGYGIAIPHGKSSAVPELRLAAGRTRDPVDYDALDGRPVRLLFLLVGPETAAGPHIKALSRISRIVRQDTVRTRLAEATSVEEFLRVLREAESVPGA
jgi:mannitol/fructose-specific phosphotransferase system IIA component (Ntr-type)